MMNVLIRDEAMNREMLQEFSVALPDDKITVRDLIRTRVRQEFSEGDSGVNPQPVSGNGVANDKSANDGSTVPRKPADWKCELVKALDAFITNRNVIFVNDRQVKSLDETIEISSETKISFLRLGFVMGS